MEITSFPHSDSLHVPPVRTQNLVGNLRVGEMVVARVRQALADGSYIIELKGRLVQADSARQFDEGQEVELVVKSLKPYVVLQALSERGEVASGEAVETIIDSLGLSSTDANQRAIAALLKFGVATSVDNISAVASFAELAATQAELDAAAYLLSIGVAPTPDLARAVAELMLDGDMLSHSLEATGQSLQDLLQTVNTTQATISDFAQVSAELDQSAAQDPIALLLAPAQTARLGEYISRLTEFSLQFRTQLPDLSGIAPAAERLANLLGEIHVLAARSEREGGVQARPVEVQPDASPAELLKAYGLPNTRQMVATLRQVSFQLGGGPLANRMAALLLSSSREAPSPSLIADASRLLTLFGEATSAMKEFLAALEATNSPLQQVKEQLQGPAQELASLLADPHDAEALRAFATGMASNELSRALEAIAEATKQLLQSNPYLRNLSIAIDFLKSSSVPAAEGTASAEQVEQDVLAILATADRSDFLSALKDIVAKLDPGETKNLIRTLQAREEQSIRATPLVDHLSRLFQSVDSIATRMASYKVLDLSSTNQTPQVLYAEIPLKTSGGTGNARLRFYVRSRKEGQPRSAEEPFLVVVDLSTVNLGRVLGNLSFKEDLLRARLTVADDSVRTMFIVHQRELEERLKEEGFRLTFDVVIRRRDEEPPPFIDVGSKAAPTELSRFDIRI